MNTSSRTRPPNPNRIETGDVVFAFDQFYEIRAIGENGLSFNVNAVNPNAEARSTISYEEIRATNTIFLHAKTFKDLRVKVDKHQKRAHAPSMAAIPMGLLLKAQKVINIVQTVKKALPSTDQDHRDRTSRLQTLLEKMGEDGCSVATYYRYEDRYEKYDGNLNRIAFSFRRDKVFHKKKFGPAVEYFLDCLFLRYNRLPVVELRVIAKDLLMRTDGKWIDPRLCLTHPPKDLCDELFNTAIPFESILENPEKARLLAKIKEPSKTDFYDYLKALKARPNLGREYLDEKYGEGTWEQEMMLFDTFIHVATEPLQHVFVDHCLLDVFVVDDETREIRKRLWLTIMIDARTRCILGFVLRYGSPSIESVMDVLAHGAWPKPSYFDEFGVEGSWLGWGIPIELSLDNAWAHHSITLENFAHAISLGGEYPEMELAFRTVYKGRLGALVERIFGNFAARIKARFKGAGAIQSSHPRDVRNAAREACLLYFDIQKFCIEEIVTYQNTRHSELGGLTPNQKWEEEMQWGSVPILPEDDKVKRLFWRDFNETRQIRKQGISAFGMNYSSRKIRKLLRNSEIGTPQLVTLRYCIDDISTIAVFDELGNFIDDAHPQQLRLADGSYLPVSLNEREIAKKLALKDGQLARAWLNYIHEIDTTIDKRRAEQRTIHKQANSLKPIKRPAGFDPARDEVQTVPQAATDYLVQFGVD